MLRQLPFYHSRYRALNRKERREQCGAPPPLHLASTNSVISLGLGSPLCTYHFAIVSFVFGKKMFRNVRLAICGVNMDGIAYNVPVAKKDC